MVVINQLRRPIRLLVTLLVFITWVSQTTGSSRIRISDSKSIYDVLKDHGLPEGLLPKGVKEFSIDDDGNFKVHLDQTCVAKLENQFKFTQNISGKLSFGQIGNMTGIETEDLFVWLAVRGVRVDIPSSGVIHFNAGGVHKQFPLSLFETPPNCVAVSSFFTDTKKVDSVLQYRRFSQKKSGSEVM